MRIHWQEGLFLQPHHLQRMQKSVEDEAASERRDVADVFAAETVAIRDRLEGVIRAQPIETAHAVDGDRPGP